MNIMAGILFRNTKLQMTSSVKISSGLRDIFCAHGKIGHLRQMLIRAARCVWHWPQWCLGWHSSRGAAGEGRPMIDEPVRTSLERSLRTMNNTVSKNVLSYSFTFVWYMRCDGSCWFYTKYLLNRFIQVSWRLISSFRVYGSALFRRMLFLKSH